MNTSFPLPLPLGWTEHLGPTGQTYYYNAHTQESTYVRPLPTFAASPQPQAAPVKKEKPVSKTPIPGTEWMRVITTQGNSFYTHKAEKRSVWVVPDEIKEAVAALERQEEEKKAAAEAAKQEEARRVAKEREREIERIKLELQSGAKRKAAEDVPLEEVIVAKKPKVEEEADEEDDEESEEEWEREAAAQLAAEAAEDRRLQEEEEAKRAKDEEAQKARESMPHLTMPERVDLSIEEGKALFKTLLREKDINPLHPWDTVLPLFISDPRYVLLPSVSARRETFDEYCRDRTRELRQSQVKKAKEGPSEEFERLLKEEVKSTRTSWTDFRRTWKKDRRFYGWGRDERERERRFREFLKELGQKKHLAAQKAEEDFFALLRQSGIAAPGVVWKEVKHKIVDDPRYDAVGSSSLREELFNTFLKVRSSKTDSHSEGSDEPSSRIEDPVKGQVDKDRERKEKKERAVKDREDKIRAERQRVEENIKKSRMNLSREEGELEFKTLLTDAIRDPQASWDAALAQLKTDPRFTNSPLPLNQQLHLFHAHVSQLRAKHLDNLHALFQSHAPELVTAFSALPLPSLLSSPPVTKLGLDLRALETEYDRWQFERNQAARKAFAEMLHENSFVDFWGKLGKIGGEGADGGVKRDEVNEEGEGEAGGGNVDMKALARSVDLRDMEKVLKNDNRYIMFNHMPEQREQWLRDYLSSLPAPKLSVHLADS